MLENNPFSRSFSQGIHYRLRSSAPMGYILVQIYLVYILSFKYGSFHLVFQTNSPLSAKHEMTRKKTDISHKFTLVYRIRKVGHYAASLLPTFLDNLSVPSSGPKKPKLLALEYWTVRLSRTLCRKLPLLSA